MDEQTKKKIQTIMRREVEVEDDMISLYSIFLKEDEIINKMPDEDRNLVNEIVNILLADTARHKNTMENLIKNL